MMFNAAETKSEASFTAMKPGVNIKAKITNIEWFVSKTGEVSENLAFEFEGTDDENPGTFRHLVWGNSFDPNHEYYSDDKAKKTTENIAHIITAFFTKEEIVKCVGNDFQQYGDAIIKVFKESKASDIELLLKVILDKKDNLSFPNFPSFIASPITPKPRVLSLSNARNAKTGQLWDRITPLNAPAPTSEQDQANDDLADEDALKDAFGTETPADDPFKL